MKDSLVKDERTEFEKSGLNADELERMSRTERRKVIKAAGLDPDKYDF
ncbi:MAG: hypothetical protein Q4F83_13645 [Eubacteriales bacterium]|nr:hypothetical protein [Eubacteriales bacterium]